MGLCEKSLQLTCVNCKSCSAVEDLKEACRCSTSGFESFVFLEPLRRISRNTSGQFTRREEVQLTSQEESNRGLITSTNTAGNICVWHGYGVIGVPPTHLMKIKQFVLSPHCLVQNRKTLLLFCRSRSRFNTFTSWLSIIMIIPQKWEFIHLYPGL